MKMAQGRDRTRIYPSFSAVIHRFIVGITSGLRSLFFGRVSMSIFGSVRFFVLLGISFVFATAALAADEPDRRSPLDRYQGDGQYSLLLCKLTLEKELMSGDLSVAMAQLSKCVGQGKSAAGKNLNAALRTVKKPAAQAALKAYHVTFVTALEGVRPGLNERKISYEERQQRFDDQLNAAWAKFEVEN